VKKKKNCANVKGVSRVGALVMFGIKMYI